MLACSLDGSIAYFSFSEAELGKSLSENEKVNSIDKIIKFELWSGISIYHRILPEIQSCCSLIISIANI